MSRRIVNPPQLVPPKGFAHAVAAGGTVYLGGQTALDADGRIVAGGIVEQFTQALSNVLVSLQAAGGQPGDLVNVTIFLTDVDDYLAHGREIGRVWREMAGTEYPAMAGIGITRLWQPEAVVEIQAIAHIGD